MFCGQRFTKEGLTCLQLECSLILHDNAWSQIAEPVSTPYSLDMSPPDFDLFPRFKKLLRGKCFHTIEEASNAVT